MADLQQIKDDQQQAWATGDFSMIASTQAIAGELLCEAVDLRAGWKVLDVATGSGNTAIAAARRFCDVTGSDYVPALLERGRERAAVEGFKITFEEGDAEALPSADESFDAVLSTYGAMFAPDQEKAASELLRVCKPGGKIGMANWTPEGMVGQFFAVNAKYRPPAPGLKPPVLWGTENRLRELFGDSITDLRVERKNLIFIFHSSEHWLDFFKAYFGPTIKTFEALDEAGQAAMTQDLFAILEKHNKSGDSTLAAPSEYLEVVATKK
jgi:ubiquinone/menaquinone biosynthesis C-methylase UbiE